MIIDLLTMLHGVAFLHTDFKHVTDSKTERIFLKGLDKKYVTVRTSVHQ